MIGRFLVCAAALASAAGCATVIRGTKQDFTIESSPPGATATLSTGDSCVTPCTLHLPRKNAFDVTFSMDGYDGGTTRVNSGWSPGGTQTFVIGNIILGGLIGMGVDAANGATRDLFPNPLVVSLIRSAPAAAPAAATAETADASAPAAAADAPPTP